jgi:outer membrane protein assembly factor BamB
MSRYGAALGCAAITVACLSACGTLPGSASFRAVPSQSPALAGDGQLAVTPGGPRVIPRGGPACPAVPARQAWAELVTGAGQRAWRTRLPADAAAPGISVQPVAIGQTAVFAQDNSVYGLSVTDGARRWQWTGGQAIYGLWTWQGTVVALSGQVSNHAVLAGIDAATGAVRWALPLPRHGLYGDQALTGDGGLAMLVPDGTLEVADLATGQLRWSRQPGGPPPAPGPTPVTAAQDERIASPVAAGTVVVDAAGGRVTAYDSRTGATLWTATGLPAYPLLRIAGGLVLVTSAAMGDGLPTAVTALSPVTGHVAWRFDVGQPAFVKGAGPAGIVFHASAPGTLYLVDPVTGRARWKAAAPVDDAVPLITASDIIQPEGDQPQRIVDRRASTGAVRWSVPVAGSQPPSVPVLRAGSRVVTVTDPPAAGGGGVLSARDLATGGPGWQASLPTPVFAPPALTPAGDILALAATPPYACPADGAAPAAARVAAPTPSA